MNLNGKRFFTFVSAFIVATGIFLSSALPAYAYCVYNGTGEPITAFQLPHSFSSFKEHIPANDKRCCNWKEASCVDNYDKGRYDGETSFILMKGEAPLFNSALQGVLDKIFKVADNATYGASSIATDEIRKKLQERRVAVRDAVVVKTRNGGIIDYKGPDDAYGCWQGPCKGPDTNNDGSKGVKS